MTKTRFETFASGRDIIILDGPIGTELTLRGIDTPPPLWSADAITNSPQTISAIHQDYAAAGSRVHTAVTFRTKCSDAGHQWKRLTEQAINITRDAIPNDHFVAGSISPIADCYRPDLSPPDPIEPHRRMANHLAQCGCDLILCETFPHSGEAIAALRASVTTGLPVWLAMTAGPEGDLMSPDQMSETAKRAEQEGASAILINCTPATQTQRFIDAFADAKLSVRFGAYANAGSVHDQIGWQTKDVHATERYSRFAKGWIQSGATIVGGCCGTRPEHISAVAEAILNTEIPGHTNDP
ncbi:homocysteine S-methyltransferase family protein [Stieleria sp. JC731]|uniref:homocysteine S-methyltransferase family protein n=1 Tax=Pirellulaceae TaxID=2691357 RepID=UPI001E57F753|nr:homocysteine S-methyltransferase family protein [Stieleria sp. JC731]MCC9599300.1 homocysteine S-methyltransferase family protein [Stieleria sp. JC731]